MCNYSKIFEQVLSSHTNHPKWANASFRAIKTISNTKVGSVGLDFIERICTDIGLSIAFPVNSHGDRAQQSPWDICIEGVSFELKTATEDVNGKFQFNHLRYHRQYQAVLCLGVSPDSLYFGIWSKADLTTGKAGTLVSMEKGANASYKLTKSPSQLDKIDFFKKKIDDFLTHFK
jgi:hypothetical protein